MTHINATQQKHDSKVSCIIVMLRGKINIIFTFLLLPYSCNTLCLFPSPYEMSPAALEEYLVLLKTFPYTSLPRTRKTLHIQANEGRQYFSCLRITSSSPNPSPVCVAHCRRNLLPKPVTGVCRHLDTTHCSPQSICNPLLCVLCLCVCVPTSLQSLHISHVS